MDSRYSARTFYGRFAAAACALLLCAAAPALAQMTPTIDYQGYLISKVTNLPVSANQSIKFVIYDSQTGISNPLFSETRCTVPVSKGRYEVEIGSSIPGGIPASIFMNHPNLWLEVQVDGTGTCSGSFEAMSPRIKLQASPYAFSAVYAATSSVATPLFLADTIGSLPQTANGAITISTNLFVQGGISVGAISPGQTLSVAGVVESSTGGFKFPDGSVQTRAAAFTMWDIAGPNIFTINPGNVAIGDLSPGAHNTVPRARLDISSAPGDTGDLLMVSTGTSQLFLVNGLGQVRGGSFYGDGSTLDGVVRKASDTMTGQLTIAGSSLTVTSPDGIYSPGLLLSPGVRISSGAPVQYGGAVLFSSNVYAAGKFYGDGSGLVNLVSSDTSKVLKSGDTMTGQLTLYGSTLTVTGGAFSVGGSTLSVYDGNTAVGGTSYLARLTVSGGIVATSSITAQSSIYAQNFNAPYGNGTFYNVTAATATFWGADVGTGFSVDTASGIRVNSGVVSAPLFIGDGSELAGVMKSTDTTKVSKYGDTMTGNLWILGSSLTVTDYGLDKYAMTVGTATQYNLVVTTTGFVGVQTPSPSAPLEVAGRLLVSNPSTISGAAHLDLSSYGGYSYLSWSDPSLVSSGGSPQGVLGFPPAVRDLIYRAMGTDPYNGGSEVFTITSDNSANWKFGIGSNHNASPKVLPWEKFQVFTNLLVSTAATNPVLFASTGTDMVSIATTTQLAALTVGGGINAVSSITAQGGFFGSGAGLTNLTASSLPGDIYISTIGAKTGSAYNAVVFSSAVYAPSGMAVGGIFTPAADLHVSNVLRVDNISKAGGPDVQLQLSPNVAGSAYIVWNEGATPTKGVLGMYAGERDLVYRAAATNLLNGVQVFRIKGDGSFLIGSGNTSFPMAAPFQVATDMAVAAQSQTPALFVSTGTGYVGISTGVPQAPLDVNGLAVLRSSAVVNGAGLTGSQTAFSVIGSTLVVLNNGTVGIGTPSPAARLDVNGVVKASGFSASREIKTNVCNAAATCSAACSAGNLVMGGGCSYAVGVDSMTATFPATTSSWECDYSGATGNITAYAICSTVQ